MSNLNAAPATPAPQAGSAPAAVARWLRYLYYLRFSILLWWFPIILVFLNSPTAARSLMSGILTPVTPLQYLCAVFFLLCTSVIALILAHVVVINGAERFGDEPPMLLQTLLANPQRPWQEFVAPVVSLLNSAFVIGYFFFNGKTEEVECQAILWGSCGGVLLALIFWYGLTAIYYLIYKPGPTDGEARAKTILFPRLLLFLSASGSAPKWGDALETASLPLSFGDLAARVAPLRWLAALIPAQGFRWMIPLMDSDNVQKKDAAGNLLFQPGPLYEGHFFSMLAAIGFFALYLELRPLTAPVLVHEAALLALILLGAAALLVVVVLLLAKPATPEHRKPLRVWKGTLALFIAFFAVSIPLIYFNSDPERFPVLAAILILVISAIWAFGAIAFVLDRFRVPVLSAFLLLLALPSLSIWCGGKPLTGAREEHYISYTGISSKPDVPTPGEVLDGQLRREYCASQPNCAELPPGAAPAVIVVTSTGGGIHAAAWTTAVLGQLEQQFSSQFHQHVLLLSTVSGGSVGLYDYLRELNPATNGGASNWKRMTVSAQCSSLEAVGWGLLYFDVPKAVLPPIPGFLLPSNGEDDLPTTPLGKDRTWALRRAMARNLNDGFCSHWAYTDSRQNIADPLSDLKVNRATVLAGQSAAPDNDQKLTLANLRAASGPASFPAFTMNTTTVEGGDRFLLANYAIPRRQSDNALAPQPAYSFLNLYAAAAPEGKPGHAVDLSLAAAAQMSATFPLVSSAATLKVAPAADAAHFIDGGYYDNDGTLSAIEFLRYAVANSKLLQPGLQGGKVGSGAPVLRVLLVEIRNSPDTANPDLVGPQDQNKPWNELSQFLAPLNGFYSAGHDSITDRNRNALGLLEGAFTDRMVVQHFVIDDKTNGSRNPPCVPQGSPPNDPLNWSLTPCQQKEVSRSSLDAENAAKYQSVKACFADAKSKLCPKINQEQLPAMQSTEGATSAK